METAIHKMTGLPAEVFKLKDRGRLERGYFADLVVFDPETIIDRATYASPLVPASGIAEVYVNGRLSYAEEKGATPGAGRLIGGNRA
jgi:N-acyl-D-amino-acid deacylase